MATERHTTILARLEESPSDNEKMNQKNICCQSDLRSPARISHSFEGHNGVGNFHTPITHYHGSTEEHYNFTRDRKLTISGATTPDTLSVSSDHKQKLILCFEMTATGTCARGIKCSFLHDPRFQLPNPERRSLEFIMQGHLHHYRAKFVPSGSMKCDTSFRFPPVLLDADAPNLSYYNPSDPHLHQRELAMLAQWLIVVNRQPKKMKILPVTPYLALKKQRLPVFVKLSN